MVAESAPLTVTVKSDTRDFERGMSAAMRAATREVDQLRKQIDQMSGNSTVRVRQMSQEISKGMDGAAASIKNVGFQISDITSQIASGQSPLRAVSVQIDQLVSAASGLRGLGALDLGALAATAGWALLPAAITAATVAAQYFFTQTQEGAQQSASELRKIAKEAEDIAKLFPGSKFALDFAKSTDDAASAAEHFEAALKLQEAALKDAKTAFTNLVPSIVDVVSLFQTAGDDTGANKLLAAYDELSKALKSGSGIAEAVTHVLEALDSQTVKNADAAQQLIEAFRQQLGVFTDAQKAIDDIRIAMAAYAQEHSKVVEAQERGAQAAAEFTTKLIEQEKGLNATRAALAGYAGDLYRYLTSLPGALAQVPYTLPAAYGAMVTSSGSAARDYLKLKSANDQVAASVANLNDEFAIALARLFQMLPATAKLGSAYRTYAEQARLYAKYLAGEGGLAARPGHSRHEIGEAADILGVDPKVLKTAIDMIKELETLKGSAYERDKLHVQLAGTNARADEAAAAAADRAAQAAQRQAESYDELIQQMTDANAVLALQAQQQGVSATAQDQARAANEATVETLQKRQALERQGITLTDQQVAQIYALALAHQNLSISLDEAKQATAEFLRQQQQSAMEAQQFAQEFAQSIGSAISGFIHDLREGKSAGEAFRNMLDKIVDSLIDMAIQALVVKPLMQGLTGILGGGFVATTTGIPGITFGKGGVVGRDGENTGRTYPLSMWKNAPSFGSGGMVGGAVPIIAHRGEVVVPKGGRLGTTVNQDIGSISVHVEPGPGQVIGTSEQGKLLGFQIEKAVQVVLVKESRPGGILRTQPGAR